MEKAGLIKVLDDVKQENLKVDQLTTDQHFQIKKYPREQEEGIDHQFDVWRFSKSIKTKLLKVSKTCEELRPLIMSSSATSEQNEMLLKEKKKFIISYSKQTLLDRACSLLSMLPCRFIY